MSPERRRCGRLRVSAAVVASLGSWLSPAHGQSNYRISPIGGRSTLLGGTGMTYGRDATAGFLNPATAVLADDNRLSFSVNFYTMAYMYAPRWYRPGPIDRTKFGDVYIDDSAISGIAFDALPSSLCFFAKAGDVPFLVRAQKNPRTREARIGLCFATIEDQSFDFSASGLDQQHPPSITRQAQTLTQRYTRFAAGPTYAMHVSDALAVGASLHASLATHRSLLAASATTYGTSPSPINSMFYGATRGDAFQLEATVGATLRFGKQTVGLSIKSPSLHIYGVGGANQSVHYDGSGSETAMTSTKGSFVSRSPLRVGLGTGIEGKWGNAELDTIISAPFGDAYSAELTGHRVTTTEGGFEDRAISLDLSERARGVVNMAAGLELFMSPSISVLSGVSTDLSAVPSGALQGRVFNYFPSRTQRITGSFGIGSHGRGGELLIGGELSMGWGERLAVNSYQLPPVIGTTDQRTYQLLFVIAGSTSLLTIKRAVKDATEVVTEPKPQKPLLPPTKE